MNMGSRGTASVILIIKRERSVALEAQTGYENLRHELQLPIQ